MFWILEKSLMSLVFIMVVHYLFNYFQTNLTIPKQKDLYYAPIKKYSKMYEIIKAKSETTTETDLDLNTMKNELKEYIQRNLRN
jgi:hypothetical protein